jgi:hypothetical protein
LVMCARKPWRVHGCAGFDRCLGMELAGDVE